MSSLRSCGPLAYSDKERAKQLLHALDDHVWGMKITALEESADIDTINTEKLFSKPKSHELSHKGRSNYDASLTSKSLITSAHVGGHDANPTNSISWLWSLLCYLLLQLLMNSMRASLMMRLPCRQESSVPCTSSTRRGGDHPGAASSAVTPPTSSLTAPRGRISTPPTSMTTPTGMTPPSRVTTRRSTVSETKRRRSSRRSCPECVLP
jgi:hypothetical protein